jgi:hypothetical protein
VRYPVLLRDEKTLPEQLWRFVIRHSFESLMHFRGVLGKPVSSGLGRGLVACMAVWLMSCLLGDEKGRARCSRSRTEVHRDLWDSSGAYALLFALHS